jgi:hypothetical protein
MCSIWQSVRWFPIRSKHPPLRMSLNDHMTTLEQLEQQLRATGRFWVYSTRIAGKTISESERRAIAQAILSAPKPWAQGVAEDFASRKYPADLDEE